MLKSTILSTVAFFFLFVGWVITPALSHECIGDNHNRPDHPHCVNGGPDSGGGDLALARCHSGEGLRIEVVTSSDSVTGNLV